MNWYLAVFRKYATFSGRARRKEFWFFALINLLVLAVLATIDGITGTASDELGIGLLAGLYGLAALVPSIAVTVRRLHDTDRSGWWILVGLIPFIGALVLLIFEVLAGTPGPNSYGADPKEAPAPAVAAQA